MVKNNELSKLSERLKELRKRARLTLIEASEKLEISKQTLISYEKGAANPPYFTLYKICEIYDSTPNYLFYGNDDVFSKDPLQRKAHALFTLIVDEDAKYDQYKSSLVISNPILRNTIAYASAAYAGGNDSSKLEIIETILGFIRNI